MMQNYRRRGNGQFRRNALAAVAQGVQLAYRNRQAAYNLGQALRKRLRLRRGKKTQETQTKPVIASYAGGNDFTMKKQRYGRKKRPTAKLNNMLVKALMHNEIYRYQNISNYDTNVGALVLRNGINTTTNTVYSPIHIYDISSFPNEAAVTAGYQFGWGDQSASATCIKDILPSQTSTGGVDVNGLWAPEKDSATTNPAVQRAMHNWTDVKIAFYGARKRTTRFQVMFVQVKHEFADFFGASGANLALKHLLQYLERPLIYSNLQTDVSGNARRFMKVIRTYNYYVSASQTTDVDTTVGKIKEVRIFMRHDRMRNYDWQHGTFPTGSQVLPHGANDGIDFQRDDQVHNHPMPKDRVYMIIKAFAPERASFTSSEPGIDANRDPTYDIIIRNSFSYANHPN